MENQQLIFTIQLTLDQVNVVLTSLGKLPYESIAPLMNSIQRQASGQMQQYQEQMAQQAAAEEQAATGTVTQ